MDFFEAQARARQRTTRLVVLFGFAVIGTVAAMYGAAVLIRHTVGEGWDYGSPEPWQPSLFGWVSVGTLAVVGAASLLKWQQYSAGGGAVAESVGARRINPDTRDFNERRLLNVVEEMALASGVPVPAVYVMPEEAGINAFAAGLTTSDAAVAVTRGTLEKLNRDELQGVIAHEFSHILNGDMRLNMRLTALVFGILVLGLAGRGILSSMRGVRTRGRDKNSGPLAAIAFTGLALWVVGYIGYFFGRLIQSAVSRQREFLADASAVQFTRNPGGITGALKKIGGYALGSSINSTKSEALRHCFFAEGFSSALVQWWATHPPLDERIRAIEPNFEGQYFEPPQIVDVAQESFVSAGLAPARPEFRPSAELETDWARASIETVGTISPEALSVANELLGSLPARLREAAHHSAEAPVLLYALLLGDNGGVAERQRAIVASRAGEEAARRLRELEPALVALGPEHRLPLLQLALPAVRQIPTAQLDAFLDTLDELVHCDAQVSAFEFALQKLLVRTLQLGRNPNAAIVQYHSFHALADDISVVLSVLARSSVREAAMAEAAFAAGAAQLKLVETKLAFQPASACGVAGLDAALEKLSLASPVIKQRTLLAASHVVSADGRLLVEEAELLRAVAAALDCPMPPLAGSRGNV